MKVPIRQNTPGGCAIYALANLFNNPRMLEGENLEIGHGVPCLNKVLQKHEPEFYIEQLFLTSTHIEYPRLTDTIIFDVIWENVTEFQKENWVRVFLLTIVGIRNHSILAMQNLKDNLFYIVDSLKEDVEVMNVNELVRRYHIIGVEVFGLWAESRDMSVYFDRGYLSHIFMQ